MSDLKDLIDRIHYSDKYNDDMFEYRHVILPKQMLKHIPNNYFTEPNGTLRLLAEREWRDIGIMQSVGWEHYETHAPERHILLFRREKDYLEKYGAHGRGAPQRAMVHHPSGDKDTSDSDEESVL